MDFLTALPINRISDQSIDDKNKQMKRRVLGALSFLPVVYGGMEALQIELHIRRFNIWMGGGKSIEETARHTV